MKHICFFNSITFWGGGEKLHLENAIEFKKLGYHITLACNPLSPLWKNAQKAGLNTFPISIGSFSFLNPFTLFKLFIFYKQQQVDTIIFSSSQDFKAASVSGYFARLKNIVYLRGLAVPIKNKVINTLIFKHILTHIIPNSLETKRTMFHHINRTCFKGKIKTIYHGLDISRVNNTSTLKEIEEKSKGIILGNAGRLTKQKGQDKLINIANQLREKNINFSLFIAGTGELEGTLHHLIKKHNLQKHVFLLGFVEDIDAFMNSIDILLITSQWEGFGFAIVEAMIKSKPVVAFDITSNPEIIHHKTTGYLVPYPNVKAFSEKTIDLITNHDLRKNMGKLAKSEALKRFILHERVKEIELFLKTS